MSTELQMQNGSSEVERRNHNRRSEVHRRTAETDIRVALSLDGGGHSKIETGVGFFDHMLTLFARHGLFDLEVVCQGDLHVDDHHSVEDVGLCLGQAFLQSLGDKKGIARYGEATVPMDESLCRAVVDLSGRFYLAYEVPIERNRVGAFSTEMAEHFWRSFAVEARMNLHIDLIRGSNAHHILEASFKATARALRRATEIDSRIEGVLSTKGVL